MKICLADLKTVVTTKGRLISQPSPAEVSATVSSDIPTDVDMTWESSSGGLAERIAARPIPSGWEPRRKQPEDVYFFHSNSGPSTACLWEASMPAISDLDAVMQREGWKFAVESGWIFCIDAQGQKFRERRLRKNSANFNISSQVTSYFGEQAKKEQQEYRRLPRASNS